MSRREKRLSQKPWISKGILKSIKTKNMLFKTHYGSNEPDKKLFYKQFLNKLTHIKSLFPQNLDNKKITSSIFLDLRKAFDSVHYDIILKKLHHYGFRGTILSFFEDYLNNRKICTKIIEKTSSFHM